MKQISYNGEMFITGTETSDALVLFVTHAMPMETPVAIEVPVLEPNNEIALHTLVLSASTQLHVTETEVVASENELEQFPIPLLLTVGIKDVQPLSAADVASMDDSVGLDLDFGRNA
ncbi:hypothetical protein GY21_15515 [Cryobacterium roopkundense]|uniref:Uncharacterized protein n=1 Tax=Cryobacterium roopkundense TaxID=1001240 RepID=A0A099J1V1_9MICO|nr:hypothetical protein [Cryobacterium roopkundense]KGJ72409.1 hypothetical protein GY21_15515 [Cryobacterium roopkundense]MBB5640587.1 hypothetical protein [Cryobacterium roopkundense]